MKPKDHLYLFIYYYLEEKKNEVANIIMLAA